MFRPILLFADDTEYERVEANLANRFQVVRTRSSAETRRYLSGNHVDVALVDIYLDGARGSATGVRISQDVDFNHVPIILISALPDQKTYPAFKNAWAERRLLYLTKKECFRV